MVHVLLLLLLLTAVIFQIRTKHHCHAASRRKDGEEHPQGTHRRIYRVAPSALRFCLLRCFFWGGHWHVDAFITCRVYPSLPRQLVKESAKVKALRRGVKEVHGV